MLWKCSRVLERDIIELDLLLEMNSFPATHVVTISNLRDPVNYVENVCTERLRSYQALNVR